MRVITLLTDFGLSDGYAGIMKGVILSIAPDCQIADITHLIPPQNVLSGALALGNAAPYFPPDTIHVAVVDPGVGTIRRPIAARLGSHFFVGPDNGLFTILLNRAEKTKQIVEIFHLDKNSYWLPQVSKTFHGRDIFAPVAAHLACGLSLQQLGTAISDPIRLDIPVPQPTAAGWRGQIIHIDAFGNLATNLTSDHLRGMDSVRVRYGNLSLRNVAHTFGEGIPGEPLAILDSAGCLSICIVNGNAAARYKASLGDDVELIRE